MPLSGSDLSFIQPAALWAMAALAIPILIHLFNRSRGRLVHIGHINLIKKARKLKVTELKLAQWLLLLLRIALLVLAALLLAGLARPGLQSSSLDTAYVTPAWLTTGSPPQIADLLQRYSDPQASRIFILQDGYPLLTQATASELRAGKIADAGVSNIWPLLADRLSVQQHLGEVEVYAVDLLSQFGAARPILPRSIKWNLSHPPAADFASHADTRVTIGFDPQHQPDAEIIRAALLSLKAHRLPGLNWEMLPIDKLRPAQLRSDWLILLSDHGLSEEQFAQLTTPVTILSDAKTGTSDAGNTYAVANQFEYLRLPYYPFTQFRSSLTCEGKDDLYSVLSNNAGQPVIQTGQHGKARLVEFNSRFGLRWSSIAAQATFPDLLLQLMQSDKQRQQSFADARVLAEQLQVAGEPATVSPTPLPRRSLQQLLAALMVLLWLLERWLSERSRREQ